MISQFFRGVDMKVDKIRHTRRRRKESMKEGVIEEEL